MNDPENENDYHGKFWYREDANQGNGACFSDWLSESECVAIGAELVDLIDEAFFVPFSLGYNPGRFRTEAECGEGFCEGSLSDYIWAGWSREQCTSEASSGSCNEWCDVCKPQDSTHDTGACFDTSTFMEANPTSETADLKTFQPNSVTCTDFLPPQTFEPDGSYGGSYGSGVPSCLADCTDYDRIYTNEVDDCVVISAWAEDICVLDCSEEELITLDTFVAGFCGLYGCPDNMFLAEYFTNADWGGEPHMTRCELLPQVEWGHGGPAWDPPVFNQYWDYNENDWVTTADNKNDEFAVRWTGNIHFEPGFYQFTSSSDDGSIIIVDGVEVLNKEYDCCSEWTSSVVDLRDGGSHTVEYKYRERGGHAYAFLSWCGAEQIIEQISIHVNDDFDSQSKC